MANKMVEKLSGALSRLKIQKNDRDFRTHLIRRHISLEFKKEISTSVRVAHMTDLHVGKVTPMGLQQVAIDLVNESNPDVVMLTGDFVCHSSLYLDHLTFFLSQLRSPTFAVLGNHDHWTNALAVKNALRQANVVVLENEHTLLDIRGTTWQIVGLDDPYTNHHDPFKATNGLKHHLPTIGLSHIGELAPTLWKNGVDLVLSGHTHAGQITVAGLNELLIGKIAGHKYVHGLYQNQDFCNRHQFVYVGAGVGSAIIPIRVGHKAKREVTLFNISKLSHEGA